MAPQELKRALRGPELLNRFSAVSQLAGQIAVGNMVSNLPRSEVKPLVESRDYQLATWQAIDEARENGEASALVHLATGLGKTTVGVIDALRFADKFMKTHDRPPRTLFAVHTNEILDQASDRFTEFAPEIPQGRFADGEKDLDKPLTFATLKSLYQNLDTIDRDSFDYIIYDEAHHMQADTFKVVVEHFTPEFRLALTGTPDRLDEKDIRELFGHEVYSKPLAQAMLEGYLADVDYHIVFDDAVKRAMEQGFDFQTLKEIKDLLANESRNSQIAAQIKTEIEKIGLNKAKTILFCSSIAQANEMAALLGGTAYHSGVDNRDEILKSFRTGETKIICTRDMFNEGVDIPDARLLVFLRSTSSRTVFEQQLGRGLRKHGDKDIVSVLDFVANIERLTQVKQLVDDISRYRAEYSLGEGTRDASFDGLEINDSSGLTLRTDHNLFDFDRLSIQLLDKIKELRFEPRDWSMLQTIEDVANLWRQNFGDARPSYELVDKGSANGLFISGSNLNNNWGGLPALKRELGFKVIDSSQTNSIEALAELWRETGVEAKPTKTLIRELSKAKEFVSMSIVNRLGGVPKLQAALGYDVIDYSKIKTIEDAAALWNERFPDVRPTKKVIVAAARAGKFISEPTVAKLGSIYDMRAALGYEEEARIETIEQAADLWQQTFPNTMPTHAKIEQASKNKRYVSNGLITKLGGMGALKRQLGYDVIERIDASQVESIEQLAEIWEQHYPDARPGKELVQQASKEGKFVSYTELRKFGGMAALQHALGHEVVRKYPQVESISELAALWNEKYPGITPNAQTVDAAIEARQFHSKPTLYKHGGIRALREAVEKLNENDEK